MPNYLTEDIRNITLVGHTGCGKTTLTEALLIKAGAIHETGTVERGRLAFLHWVGAFLLHGPLRGQEP